MWTYDLTNNLMIHLDIIIALAKIIYIVDVFQWVTFNGWTNISLVKPNWMEQTTDLGGACFFNTSPWYGNLNPRNASAKEWDENNITYTVVDLDVIVKKADVTSPVQVHYWLVTSVTSADGGNLHWKAPENSLLTLPNKSTGIGDWVSVLHDLGPGATHLLPWWTNSNLEV